MELAVITVNPKQVKLLQAFAALHLIRIQNAFGVRYTLSGQNMCNVVTIVGPEFIAGFLQDGIHGGWFVSPDGPDRRHYDDIWRIIRKEKARMAEAK